MRSEGDERERGACSASGRGRSSAPPRLRCSLLAARYGLALISTASSPRDPPAAPPARLAPSRELLSAVSTPVPARNDLAERAEGLRSAGKNNEASFSCARVLGRLPADGKRGRCVGVSCFARRGSSVPLARARPLPRIMHGAHAARRSSRARAVGCAFSRVGRKRSGATSARATCASYRHLDYTVSRGKYSQRCLG